MTAGRVLALALVLAGLLAGVGVWYAQTRAFYAPVALEALPMDLADGTAITLHPTLAQAIDSDSSPLRFRACLTLSRELVARLAELAAPAAGATPLIAPDWFDCFDAARLTADLAAGRARALMVQGNIRYGFDRVMALYPDGRAYLWHQANACGNAHYNGRPLPAGCPPAPQR